MELQVREVNPITKGDANIMPFSKKNCTIADIEALPEWTRAELINGELIMMSPPNTVHQELLGELYVEIHNYIKRNKGKCRVYAAPYGVQLHNDDKTFLEPDIVVICDRDKIDGKWCHGAPDWVIEIISPSTRKRDYGVKLEEYRKAGVRAYWIVDPPKQVVWVYYLQTKDEPVKYSFQDVIKVSIYEDFEIDFAEITADLTEG